MFRAGRHELCNSAICGLETNQRAGELNALRERLLPFLEALSWEQEVAIRQTWTIAKGDLDRPEDAFAPAMLLSALLPEDADVAAWVAARPPGILQALTAARA